MASSILVIDDSLLVRKQVAAALKDLGHTITEATDGQDALEKLASSPDTCLIVCDVNMPRMNGLEFLEQLGARSSEIPVVMLTTEGQPEVILKARALGARCWIVKPFKPEFLVATVKKLASGAVK